MTMLIQPKTIKILKRMKQGDIRQNRNPYVFLYVFCKDPRRNQVYILRDTPRYPGGSSLD